MIIISTDEIKEVKKEIVFTKNTILNSKKYAKRRDLLSVLLKDNGTYTTSQIEKLMADFMKKGRVK